MDKTIPGARSSQPHLPKAPPTPNNPDVQANVELEQACRTASRLADPQERRNALDSLAQSYIDVPHRRWVNPRSFVEVCRAFAANSDSEPCKRALGDLAQAYSKMECSDRQDLVHAFGDDLRGCFAGLPEADDYLNDIAQFAQQAREKPIDTQAGVVRAQAEEALVVGSESDAGHGADDIGELKRAPNSMLSLSENELMSYAVQLRKYPSGELTEPQEKEFLNFAYTLMERDFSTFRGSSLTTLTNVSAGFLARDDCAQSHGALESAVCVLVKTIASVGKKSGGNALPIGGPLGFSMIDLVNLANNLSKLAQRNHAALSNAAQEALFLLGNALLNTRLGDRELNLTGTKARDGQVLSNLAAAFNAQAQSRDSGLKRIVPAVMDLIAKTLVRNAHRRGWLLPVGNGKTNFTANDLGRIAGAYERYESDIVEDVAILRRIVLCTASTIVTNNGQQLRFGETETDFSGFALKNLLGACSALSESIDIEVLKERTDLVHLVADTVLGRPEMTHWVLVNARTSVPPLISIGSALSKFPDVRDANTVQAVRAAMVLVRDMVKADATGANTSLPLGDGAHQFDSEALRNIAITCGNLGASQSNVVEDLGKDILRILASTIIEIAKDRDGVLPFGRKRLEFADDQLEDILLACSKFSGSRDEEVARAVAEVLSVAAKTRRQSMQIDTSQPADDSPAHAARPPGAIRETERRQDPMHLESEHGLFSLAAEFRKDSSAQFTQIKKGQLLDFARALVGRNLSSFRSNSLTTLTNVLSALLAREDHAEVHRELESAACALVVAIVNIGKDSGENALPRSGFFGFDLMDLTNLVASLSKLTQRSNPELSDAAQEALCLSANALQRKRYRAGPMSFVGSKAAHAQILGNLAAAFSTLVQSNNPKVKLAVQDVMRLVAMTVVSRADALNLLPIGSGQTQFSANDVARIVGAYIKYNDDEDHDVAKLRLVLIHTIRSMVMHDGELPFGKKAMEFSAVALKNILVLCSKPATGWDVKDTDVKDLNDLVRSVAKTALAQPEIVHGVASNSGILPIPPLIAIAGPLSKFADVQHASTKLSVWRVMAYVQGFLRTKATNENTSLQFGEDAHQFGAEALRIIAITCGNLGASRSSEPRHLGSDMLQVLANTIVEIATGRDGTLPLGRRKCEFTAAQLEDIHHVCSRLSGSRDEDVEQAANEVMHVMVNMGLAPTQGVVDSLRPKRRAEKFKNGPTIPKERERPSVERDEQLRFENRLEPAARGFGIRWRFLLSKKSPEAPSVDTLQELVSDFVSMSSEDRQSVARYRAHALLGALALLPESEVRTKAMEEVETRSNPLQHLDSRALVDLIIALNTRISHTKRSARGLAALLGEILDITHSLARRDLFAFDRGGLGTVAGILSIWAAYVPPREFDGIEEVVHRLATMVVESGKSAGGLFPIGRRSTHSVLTVGALLALLAKFGAVETRAELLAAVRDALRVLANTLQTHVETEGSGRTARLKKFPRLIRDLSQACFDLAGNDDAEVAEPVGAIIRVAAELVISAAGPSGKLDLGDNDADFSVAAVALLLQRFSRVAKVRDALPDSDQDVVRGLRKALEVLANTVLHLADEKDILPCGIEAEQFSPGTLRNIAFACLELRQCNQQAWTPDVSMLRLRPVLTRTVRDIGERSHGILPFGIGLTDFTPFHLAAIFSAIAFESDQIDKDTAAVLHILCSTLLGLVGDDDRLPFSTKRDQLKFGPEDMNEIRGACSHFSMMRVLLSDESRDLISKLSFLVDVEVAEVAPPPSNSGYRWAGIEKIPADVPSDSLRADFAASAPGTKKRKDLPLSAEPDSKRPRLEGPGQTITSATPAAVTSPDLRPSNDPPSAARQPSSQGAPRLVTIRDLMQQLAASSRLTSPVPSPMPEQSEQPQQSQEATMEIEEPQVTASELMAIRTSGNLPDLQ